MELSIYEVIKRPLLSEKAQRVNHDQHKLVLEVHPQANKPMVKEAITKLFNVKVADVNIQVRKGKNRRSSRSRAVSQGGVRKIAYVTLKPGQSLDLFGHGQMQQQPAPEQKPTTSDAQ